MKAIVKPRPVQGQEWSKGFQLIDKPIPVVDAPNDVIIHIEYAAVCGTDNGIYHSKNSLYESMQRALTDPITVGHEFSGRIVDAGEKARKHIARMLIKKARKNPSVKKILKGESAGSFAKSKKFFSIVHDKFHASAEMHIVCGTCYQCSLGEKHVCRNTIIKGLHDDGAFAEYVKVPAENLLLYHAKEIPLEIIAWMDALGNATHTVLSTEVKKRNVLILGCGVQGLMSTAVAKQSGASRIYVTDASHEDFSHEKLVTKRFALAREYGANDCFDMTMEEDRERFKSVIMQATNDTGVDAAFDTSGNYQAYKNALDVLRMGGSFSLLGLPAGKMEIDFAKHVIFNGITIRGIIGRRVFETWDQMEALLKDGLAKKFLRTGFITHTFPLEEFDKAFDAIKKGDAYKVLLKP